jgi:ribulose-phosphate 3-epimerase
MVQIFPSLIAADILNLTDEINRLDRYTDGYHIDIMDFLFVPNLTWGPMFANAIRMQTQKTLWIDLLVDYPEKYFDQLQLHANDIVTIHYEAQGVQQHIYDLIERIHSNGWRASVSINAETPVAALEPYLQKVDDILLMSVNPGFSGQNFVSESVDRLKQLNDLRKNQNLSFTIGMDGGIDRYTLPELIPYDVNQVAVGSGIFGADNPITEIAMLKNIGSK